MASTLEKKKVSGGPIIKHSVSKTYIDPERPKLVLTPAEPNYHTKENSVVILHRPKKSLFGTQDICWRSKYILKVANFF